MKKPAIFSLICGIVVFLVLCGVFCWLMLGNSSLIFGHIDESDFSSNNPSESGNAELTAKDIDNLEVSWTSGAVVVERWDGDTIRLTEDTGTDKTELLRYSVSGNCLTVADRKISWWNRMFDRQSQLHTLTVQLPAAVERLEKCNVNVVSANLNISDVSAKELELDTTSGEITGINLSSDKLDVESVSGEVGLTRCVVSDLKQSTTSGSFGFEGTVQTADLETVSGDLNMSVDNTLQKFDSDCVSGSVQLNLPADASFAAKVSTVSGDLNSDFAGTRQNGIMTVGDGKGEFKFDSVSGNVSIYKLK